MTEGSEAFKKRQGGRLRSRAALMIGFGALLSLMVFMGTDSLRTLEVFEASNTRIRQDFLDREHSLDQVRAGMYESASSLSDYFFGQPDANSQETLRIGLQSIRDETAAALAACIRSLAEERRQPFEQLAVELQSYWSTIDAVLRDSRTPAKNGSSALRAAALQQHNTVLSITKELSELNDTDLKESEQRIEQLSAQFRHRLLIIVTLGVGFGLALAVTTVGYAGHLEKSLEEKYEESLRAQSALRELSQRLVDTEERERRAISRELHDEIGQSLSALLLDVQNLMEIGGDEGVFHEGLQKIKASAENCLEEVRNMSLLLRPSMLDDLGLVAALDWQAREVSKRTGIVVEMTEENVSDTLPEAQKTCIYRIVQEALNNCSKHAHAKNVRVFLRQEPNHLRVVVEDDGSGFDRSRTGGLGLLGMKERVQQLGGTLNIDSEPGRGAKLQVDLPLLSERNQSGRVRT